jgi:hypothetical protein
MGTLTRRTFLKGSAGAVALAALPISLGAEAGTRGLPIHWMVENYPDGSPFKPANHLMRITGRLAVTLRSGHETLYEWTDWIPRLDTDISPHQKRGEAEMLKIIRREGFTNPRMPVFRSGTRRVA